MKTIAIELIRQTPLYDIKYLDILTLAECWKRKENACEKDWNFNTVKSPGYDECDACNLTKDKLSTYISNNNNINKNYPTNEGGNTDNSDDSIDVEDLKRKCQSSESYVPVKQKLVLFESLCRLGRKVRSSEDVSYKIEVATKRARSLHDLTHLQTHIAVREICKLFESKCDKGGQEETVAKSPTRLVSSKINRQVLTNCDSPIVNVQRLVSRNKYYNSVT